MVRPNSLDEKIIGNPKNEYQNPGFVSRVRNGSRERVLQRREVADREGFQCRCSARPPLPEARASALGCCQTLRRLRPARLLKEGERDASRDRSRERPCPRAPVRARAPRAPRLHTCHDCPLSVDVSLTSQASDLTVIFRLESVQGFRGA